MGSHRAIEYDAHWSIDGPRDTFSSLGYSVVVSAAAGIPYHGSLGVPSTANRGFRTPASQKILLVLAFVLSIGSLVYVLHDFEPEKLMGEIRAMHWGWVGAAVLFDILVYFLQGWRWSLLLRPVADIPYARSIRAIYVGLFANEILPLRTRRDHPLLLAGPVEQAAVHGDSLICLDRTHFRWCLVVRVSLW